MIFDVAFYCNGRPWGQAHYVAGFLPRVGDTIVDELDATYTVIEVEYMVPKDNARHMKAVVYVE